MKSILVRALVLMTLVFATGAWAGQRIALVIGNSDYQSGRLSNPANDVDDMARVLTDLGFAVDKIKNATHREMEEAIQAFGDKFTKDSVVVFYYAGHAVEVNGHNYLLPIGSNIRKEHEVKFKAVNLGFVLEGFRSTNKGLNLVILDACRDNPLERSFRNNVRGLAQVSAPGGTIIAYATAPGSVAAEGKGRNGIYTHHLLKRLKIPDLEVVDLLRRVAADVDKATGGKQRPWLSIDYTGQFAFIGNALDEHKLYVAVLEFKAEGLQQPGSHKIMHRLLEQELPKTGRFRVLDHSKVLEHLQDEFEIEGSGLIDESQALRVMKRFYKVTGGVISESQALRVMKRFYKVTGGVISGEIIGFGEEIFITAKHTKTTGDLKSVNITLPRSQLSVQGMRQATRQLAKQLAGQASGPVTKPSQYTLTVRSNVWNDQVTIDGKPYGSTRLDVVLAPGEHVIRIEKEGYKSFEQTINLQDDQTVRGKLRLKKKEKSKPTKLSKQAIEETYLTYLDQHPDDINTRLKLIAMYMHGRYKAAQPQIEYLLSLDPDNYMGYYYLGEIYRMNNLCDASVKAYAQALVFNPNYLPARVGLEKMKKDICS